jgi:flagellar biosynthetic protein FliR
MNTAPALYLVLPEFQSFLVLISRIGGIVAAFPMLGGRTVPAQIKIALVVMLGVALSPLIRLPPMSRDAIEMTAGLASELLIGLVIGLPSDCCLRHWKWPVICWEPRWDLARYSWWIL